MKTRLYVLAMAVTLSALSLHAATSYTKIHWTWTAPTGTPTASSYNLYQTSSACSSSYAPVATDKKNTTPITTTSFDTPYTANTTGCTYVTAVSALGVEGAPSTGYFLDTSAPGQPQGLTGTPQ